MKKIILMPDSFKGTLTATKFCDIAKKTLTRHFTDCEIVSLPLADGGEGTTDCFLQLDGYERVNLSACNAYMENVDCYYAKKGDVAVVEMAMCASLPSVKGRENPSLTTTYGVGQLVRHAVENGAKTVIIGLGGSCTNDAGTGMARALGARFFDKNGGEFIPAGSTLDKIEGYDLSFCEQLLQGVKIVAMCDIDNTLYGKNGAAYIFAPQKGADGEMVELLDKNLRQISALVENKTGKNYSEIKGAGAAGGMGFGVCAFLGGSLKAGIDIVLDTVNFDVEVKEADLVITGEGRLDSQSLSGKAVVGISRRAKNHNVPVIAVVGSVADGYEEAYSQGLTAVFTTNFAPLPFEEAIKYTEENLARRIDNIARILIKKI